MVWVAVLLPGALVWRTLPPAAVRGRGVLAAAVGAAAVFMSRRAVVAAAPQLEWVVALGAVVAAGLWAVRWRVARQVRR